MKQYTDSKGITLIALVITIIILLILAGVSISLVAGENGILTRATNAVEVTEITAIEESARLHYIDRKVGEVTGGENATIAGVISDLKAEGYHIEERTSGTTTVNGIVLSENNIELNKNSEYSLTYTLVYAGEGTVRYFAEVRGKYYEIEFNDGNITVNAEEIDLESINNAPNVTAQSNAENIATAGIGENNAIVINSLNEVGEAIITIKEENTGATVTCNVEIIAMIEQIRFKESIVRLDRGSPVDLSSLITVTPEDATEGLVWSVENSAIASIAGNVNICGLVKGTTNLSVTSESGSIVASAPVNVYVGLHGVTFGMEYLSMKVGETYVLTVKPVPNDCEVSIPLWSNWDKSRKQRARVCKL